MTGHDTAEELRGFLRGKLQTARAFTMPKANQVVKMLRADLGAAKIEYRDDSGRVVDFHALRHSFGSMLAASSVHPKTAQKLMRHSTISLTMDRYSHVYREQEAAAIIAF